MCKSIAFALALMAVLGCSRSSSYNAEANPSNFLPSTTGGRTWVFHTSPSFDAGRPGKLTEFVDDALKQLGLPPVHSDGTPSQGDWRWSEGVGDAQFTWSSFEWADYSEGPLSVRTGAYNREPNKSRVIFVSL